MRRPGSEVAANDGQSCRKGRTRGKISALEKSYWEIPANTGKNQVMGMPWVDENDCTGCGICVEECPVDTIYMDNEKAEIDMDNCIRCGICHGVCPENAVRHDSEKIPDEVKANVLETREFMSACAEHLGDEKERQKCLTRIIKHFNKNKIVAEKTVEELQKLIEE